MELINNTSFSAKIYKASTENNTIEAAIIVKVTYDVKDGLAIPSKDQIWNVTFYPYETEYGMFESDAVFYRGAVDLLVFGSAKALASNKRVRQSEVAIYLNNNLINKILVFGKREWMNSFTGLQISDPEEFSEIPLTLSNAYGGYDEWDAIKFPFGNNPLGKGFIWEKNNAVGKELPNIEDPKRRIINWNDQPDPVGVCMCPMNELRMRGNVVLDQGKRIKEINPKIFNCAFPSMIINNINPGDKIKIEGMSENGGYFFTVPNNHLNAKLIFGEEKSACKLDIDQIGIIPDKNQAFISYRHPFRYLLTPLKKRSCEVNELLIS